MGVTIAMRMDCRANGGRDRGMACNRHEEDTIDKPFTAVQVNFTAEGRGPLSGAAEFNFQSGSVLASLNKIFQVVGLT